VGWLGACATDDGGDGGSDIGPRPDNATRSATCLQWQDAVCDYEADMCQSMTRAECDDVVQSLFCKSNEVMQACITALAAGTCPDTPDACRGVTDPAPAQWYCDFFADTLCARGETCNLGDKDSCLQEAALELDCDSAVGADPQTDTCLADMASWPCESLQGGQLPANCQAVIKFMAPSSKPPSGNSWLTPLFRASYRGPAPR